jgi:hypothetical protein
MLISYLVDKTKNCNHRHAVEDDAEDGRDDKDDHQQDRRDGEDHAGDLPRPKGNLNKVNFYVILRSTSSNFLQLFFLNLFWPKL